MITPPLVISYGDEGCFLAPDGSTSAGGSCRHSENKIASYLHKMFSGNPQQPSWLIYGGDRQYASGSTQIIPWLQAGRMIR